MYRFIYWYRTKLGLTKDVLRGSCSCHHCKTDKGPTYLRMSLRHVPSLFVPHMLIQHLHIWYIYIYINLIISFLPIFFHPNHFLRLPDHGARSDVIRYALIYHHGGPLVFFFCAGSDPKTEMAKWLTGWLAEHHRGYAEHDFETPRMWLIFWGIERITLNFERDERSIWCYDISDKKQWGWYNDIWFHLAWSLRWSRDEVIGIFCWLKPARFWLIYD